MIPRLGEPSIADRCKDCSDASALPIGELERPLRRDRGAEGTPFFDPAGHRTRIAWATQSELDLERLPARSDVPGLKVSDQRFEAERVAWGAQSGDDPQRNGRDVGMLAEALPGVDVREVHLDHGEP